LAFINLVIVFSLGYGSFNLKEQLTREEFHSIVQCRVSSNLSNHTFKVDTLKYVMNAEYISSILA
jgi:hypothetical protein